MNTLFKILLLSIFASACTTPAQQVKMAPPSANTYEKVDDPAPPKKAVPLTPLRELSDAIQHASFDQGEKQSAMWKVCRKAGKGTASCTRARKAFRKARSKHDAACKPLVRRFMAARRNIRNPNAKERVRVFVPYGDILEGCHPGVTSP